MTDLPRKSRSGLTRCGACRAHVLAADRPSLTDCPFCGSNLLRDRARLTPTGRAGALAVALLTFGATGCASSAEDETEQTPPADETSGDEYEEGEGGEQIAQPVYGEPAPEPRDQYGDDPDESHAQPDYGLPEDDLPE